ncbi:MAG TPA: basic secretory protein-like protein [Planctomycetaceae bacterium]|nr:basic secretory protein-like protein [Planctomycetaceae bacterium]
MRDTGQSENSTPVSLRTLRFTGQALLRLLLVGAISAAACSDEPPADASAPVKTEPKLTLILEGPVDAEFAPIAGRLTTLYYECYPKLLTRFEHPTRKAPRKIRLTFDPKLDIPAHCSGDRVTVSIKWLKAHPDDIGLLTHELTHAVQAYPDSNPGWLTEGIADYARKQYGPEKQPGWNFPDRLSSQQSYTNSYGVTARFLVWIEEKHPGTVDTLHRRMQEREFRLEDFQTATGKTVDELWRECVAELNHGQ